jgi:hypothetical protein
MLLLSEVPKKESEKISVQSEETTYKHQKHQPWNRLPSEVAGNSTQTTMI